MDLNRHLLPKPTPRRAIPPLLQPRNTSSSSSSSKVKKITTACDACRQRKTACGGQKPVCSTCEKKHTSCRYQRPAKDKELDRELEIRRLHRVNDELRQRNKVYEELIDQQQDGSPILTSSEGSGNMSTINSFRDSLALAVNKQTLDSRISTSHTDIAALPSIYSEIAALLHIHHPLAFPSNVVVNRASIEAANTYLHDLIVDKMTAAATLPNQEKSTFQRQVVHKKHNHHNDDILSQSSRPSMTNVAEADIIKETTIKLQQWTDIPVSQQDVMGAIKQYLDIDHPVTAIIDMSLFLKDLQSGSSNFCSPFLLHAFLAYSLHTYAIDTALHAVPWEDFRNHAITLYDGDWHDDDVNNVAALIFLSLSFSITYAGETGMKYLLEAVNMSTRLRLFNVVQPIADTELTSSDEDVRRATAYIAWGTYNLASMHNLGHMMFELSSAPSLTLLQREDGSPIYLQLSDGLHRFSNDPSPTFLGLCKLCPVLVDMRYHRSKNQDQLQSALSRFKRIVDILEASGVIEQSLSGKSCRLTCQKLILHIWCHAVIIELFRPFIAEARQASFRSWAKTPNLPEAIFSASLERLKALTIEFSTEFTSTSQNIWWAASLLSIANAALRNPSDPNSGILFLLSVRCFQNLSFAYPILLGAAKALLAMAVASKALNVQEVRTILSITDRSSLESKTLGSFSIDLDTAVAQPEEARIDVLAERLDTLDILETWTQDILSD